MLLFVAGVVGEVGREGDGELGHAGDGAVFAPGGLEDELAQAVFLYGIGVGVAGGKHVADFRLRGLAVAGHEVCADEAVVLREGLARALVHIEDGALKVADGDGAADGLCPVGNFGGYGEVSVCHKAEN